MTPLPGTTCVLLGSPIVVGPAVPTEPSGRGVTSVSIPIPAIAIGAFGQLVSADIARGILASSDTQRFRCR